MLKENQFIPCESIFDAKKIPFNFWEESILKKLDEKSIEIEESLKNNRNNYEAVLFQNLSYAFGLKVNAQIFKQMAESLDFATVNKIRQNQTQLEALFFGISDWLNQPQDDQMKIWKREFDFLNSKFELSKLRFNPKFSKLRPPNFPTIRLSQLASLYHLNQNLFSKLISTKKIDEIYEIFKEVKASEYWNNRFNFAKISPVDGEKYITKDFVDLLLINAILPLKYTYNKNLDENINDEILDFYLNISPEKNTIIDGWKMLKVPVLNALETQALLFHYKNYCQKKTA
jgi:Protein of unknown function (DUF2851).